MSETMKEISIINVRSELNLIYALSRMVSITMELAQTNPVARSALRSGVGAILEQTHVLMHDVYAFVDGLETSEQPEHDAGR